jgi:hypothetical protein
MSLRIFPSLGEIYFEGKKYEVITVILNSDKTQEIRLKDLTTGEITQMICRPN